MRYFESCTFKLLRYDDYNEFIPFFDNILSAKKCELNRLLEEIHNSKIFSEATLRQVANRSELGDKPLDVERAEKLLN